MKVSQRCDIIFFFEKIITKMKTTQLIREELGLSQLALAQYLSIPLSQLAMHETGKRDLPAKALVKIAEILIVLNQNQEESQAQKSKIEEFIAFQTKELEYKKLKEQRKLDAIIRKYNQNLKLSTLVNHLEKRKTEQVSIFLIQVKKENEKNSLTNQIKQVLKLEGIKGQLNYINNLSKK